MLLWLFRFALDEAFETMIEQIAREHDHGLAAEALQFDVGADADDFEQPAACLARMRPFHLDGVPELIVRNVYHGSSCILTAPGILPRPGIVITSPVSGMMNPAPADKSTSRM